MYNLVEITVENVMNNVVLKTRDNEMYYIV